MLKEPRIELNFYWKLFERIRDRFEKTLIDLRSCKRFDLNHLTLIKRLDRFFYYDPLSTSSFRKNLILSETINFQKS